MEVTALLTCGAGVIRVTFCRVWSLADITYTAFADCTVGSTHTLELWARVTGAFVELGENRQTLRRNALFLTHFNTLESGRAVRVIFTGTCTYALTRARRLVVIQLDAKSACFRTIGVALTRLAKSGETTVVGVQRLTCVRDTDLSRAAIVIIIAVTVDVDVNAHIDVHVDGLVIGLFTIRGAGGLDPALIPTRPRVTIGLADLVIIAVVITLTVIFRDD